jgi:hypothetical protein
LSEGDDFVAGGQVEVTFDGVGEASGGGGEGDGGLRVAEFWGDEGEDETGGEGIAGSEAVDGQADGVEVVWEWGAGNLAGGGGEEPSSESSGGGRGGFASGEGDVVEVRELADDEAGGFFRGGVGVGVGQDEVPGVIVTADEETDRWHQGAQGA